MCLISRAQDLYKYLDGTVGSPAHPLFNTLLLAILEKQDKTLSPQHKLLPLEVNTAPSAVWRYFLTLTCCLCIVLVVCSLSVNSAHGGKPPEPNDVCGYDSWKVRYPLNWAAPAL